MIGDNLQGTLRIEEPYTREADLFEPWRTVAQGTVRSPSIYLPPPLFDQDLSVTLRCHTPTRGLNALVAIQYRNCCSSRADPVSAAGPAPSSSPVARSVPSASCSPFSHPPAEDRSRVCILTGRSARPVTRLPSSAYPRPT